MRLIVGKLAGILLVAAAITAAFEACTFVLSLLVAPSQDIPTDDWLPFAGAGEAIRDYLTVFAGVAGWAIFSTTLAVIFLSAPLALAVPDRSRTTKRQRPVLWRVSPDECPSTIRSTGQRRRTPQSAVRARFV